MRSCCFHRREYQQQSHAQVQVSCLLNSTNQKSEKNDLFCKDINNCELLLSGLEENELHVACIGYMLLLWVTCCLYELLIGQATSNSPETEISDERPVTGNT